MLCVNILKQGIELFSFVCRSFLGCCREYHSCSAAQVLVQPTMLQVAACNLHALTMYIKGSFVLCHIGCFLFVVSLGVAFVALTLQVLPQPSFTTKLVIQTIPRLHPELNSQGRWVHGALWPV